MSRARDSRCHREGTTLPATIHEEAVMAKFLYLYFGGSPPKSPEEGKKVMDAWMAWFGKAGDKVVDGGAPLGPRKSVGGNATAGATGYSIVSAASLDEAISLT